MDNVSNKRRFKSRYGAEGDITAAQYITELLCNRSYQKSNPNGTLPDKFWNYEEWGKFFAFQITTINKLLNTYHIDAILKVLREEKWVHSATILNNSYKVKQKLITYNKVIEGNIKREKTDTIKSKVDQLPNKKVGANNIFNKLKGL